MVVQSSPLGQIWFVVVAAAFLGLLVAGGTSAPEPLVRLVFSIGGLAIIVGAAWMLRQGLPRPLGTSAAVIGICIVLVFVLQLIPLPASWQSYLPGRETFGEASRLAGLTNSTSPISLSPSLTLATVLTLLPGVAMFAAALSLEPKYRMRLSGLLVGFAVLSALLGIAQRFSSSTSLYLYDYGLASNVASGFFANRNFFAALLYISIPMLAVVAFSAVKNQTLPGWLAALFGFAYLAVILGGLAAAASRAGIILSMASIIAAAFLPWGTLTAMGARFSRRTLLYATMLFLFVFSQFGLVGLLRLIETDPLADYRSVIRQVSWTATSSFFPAGSGFGTFVPVYQIFEKPADMLAQYVNHVHNDWLEIVLEGGLPALILLLCGVIWVVAATTRIWMRRSDAGGDLVMTASTVGVTALMLHSVVDYPLRTPALMGVFGLCLGFMASSFVVRQQRVHSRPQVSTKVMPLAPVGRKPFTPFKPRQAESDASQADKP